jgi:general secretion pathway protein A
MYTSFFNFTDKPFQLTPDPEFLFMSKVHKKALTYLKYGITSDSGGFILVTGEVGTGKTTLIRSIMEGLKKDIIFSRINNTHLTSDLLISMINEDFGLDVNNKTKTQMLRDLTDFLIEQYRKKRKSVLIIDEAQNLAPDLLEEIRLISNLETSKSKLLLIILVGQPELRKVLSQPELRSFRQRINVSCHICPLTMIETEEYIFHRLEVAGNREAVNFQNGCIDLIHNFARGVPRLINIACDFLLLTAFVDKTKEISLDMAQEVINDLEKENRYWQDAIPERYFNDVKVLEEISKKSENSEVTSSKRKLSYVEKEKFLEKRPETAKLLNAAVERFNTERDTINVDAKLQDIVQDIVKEIEDIKSRFPKEVKQITSGIQGKRHGGIKTENEITKNLWTKIFNKRRIS